MEIIACYLDTILRILQAQFLLFIGIQILFTEGTTHVQAGDRKFIIKTPTIQRY